ncbi:vinorine synthase-like protein [Tanacetum coccineum]
MQCEWKKEVVGGGGVPGDGEWRGGEVLPVIGSGGRVAKSAAFFWKNQRPTARSTMYSNRLTGKRGVALFGDSQMTRSIGVLWAAAARGSPETLSPSFAAYEVFPNNPCLESMMPGSKLLITTKLLSTKRFLFNSTALARLKSEPVACSSSLTSRGPTRLEATSGVIWKAASKAASSIRRFGPETLMLRVICESPEKGHTSSSQFVFLNDTPKGGGVEATVTLSPDEMEIFQRDS